MMLKDSLSVIHDTIHFTVSFLKIHPYLVFLTCLLLRVLYRRYASPLRAFPGPFIASFTRLWQVYSTARGQTHLDHIALHQLYGPIVRIAPDEVSLSSPQAARVVFSAGNGFHKTDFYWVFPPSDNPDIFTEIREDIHAAKKRVVNVPYSLAAMKQLSPFIDDTIDVLVARLGQFCVVDEQGGGGLIPGYSSARSGKVDLGNWLHYFAFDVLGEIAFSRSFGFLAAGRDVHDAIKTIDDGQRYNGIVGQVPFWHYFLRNNPVWKLVPFLSKGPTLIERIALEEMAKRRPFSKESDSDGKDGRRDLLGSLIKGHLKDGSDFSEGDVFAVAHGAIYAGSDSTASTMQSFFHNVLSTPDVYGRLQAELNDAIDTGSIPQSGNVEFAQAQALPYLQACLKEAMRLRPAVGLNSTRHVPPGGLELDGVFFKGGTRVAVNAWVVHRNREIFGHDADIYRPERWLEDEEKIRTMDRFMFQFGGGAHVCIGRNLAILEINKVIPRLLRDFRFELVHPGRPLKANASFFVVQEGLEVYISKQNEERST